MHSMPRIPPRSPRSRTPGMPKMIPSLISRMLCRQGPTIGLAACGLSMGSSHLEWAPMDRPLIIHTRLFQDQAIPWARTTQRDSGVVRLLQVVVLFRPTEYFRALRADSSPAPLVSKFGPSQLRIWGLVGSSPKEPATRLHFQSLPLLGVGFIPDPSVINFLSRPGTGRRALTSSWGSIRSLIKRRRLGLLCHPRPLNSRQPAQMLPPGQLRQ